MTGKKEIIKKSVINNAKAIIIRLPTEPKRSIKKSLPISPNIPPINLSKKYLLGYNNPLNIENSIVKNMFKIKIKQ